MTTCPKCKSVIANVSKQWNYAQFSVKAYECKCGQKFREYRRDGKLEFILMKSQVSAGWEKIKT